MMQLFVLLWGTIFYCQRGAAQEVSNEFLHFQILAR